MNILLVIAVVIIAALCCYIGLLRGQARAQNTIVDKLSDDLKDEQAKRTELEQSVQALREDKVRASSLLAGEQKRLQDMEAHYKSVMADSKAQFKELSAEVLKERREELEKTGFDGIKKISDSLKQDIEGFKKRVNEVNEQDVSRVATLKAEINNLLNQTTKVSTEANHLAEAIRGKAQVTGQWSEMQLKKVLELGGLKESVDYSYQETFSSPEAKRKDLRADVILKLPEDRWLVIDSKATIEAYVEYASAAEDSAEKQGAYARIVESIKNHVKEMMVASYAKNIEKTRGVKVHSKMLMYIPFDEVYLIAMKEKYDSELLLREWAWKNDIVFVNSSCVLPIAQMLSVFWAQKKSDQKANDIIEETEKLLDKCYGFVDSFVKIGSGLETAVESYNTSLKRLAGGPGNIMKKLADIQELGVKITAKAKTIGEVEEKAVDKEVAKAAGVSELSRED